MSIFAGTVEFHARSLKLEEPESCFHVKLGFSVHENAFYKHMMQRDLMHWFMSEERSHFWPVCVSSFRLPNSQDAHTTPVCSTKTKQSNSSMIRNLKSRNKLTRLTKAADSECAKNKLSLKEFSTKRKWHMNLKYKNKLDSIKQIPFHKQITKTKSVLLDQVKWLGFCTFHLGSRNFHFDYRVILEVAKPELLTQFISSKLKKTSFLL